eukprot:7180034-Pyramimonas_sp.AAC.1
MLDALPPLPPLPPSLEPAPDWLRRPPVASATRPVASHHSPPLGSTSGRSGSSHCEKSPAGRDAFLRNGA